MIRPLHGAGQPQDDGAPACDYHRRRPYEKDSRMLYLWLKALHIIAVVCWFAALLPAFGSVRQ